MSGPADLVALVADKHQEHVLDVLLDKRRDSLGLRPISFKVHRHPRRDPGVYRGAQAFLAPLRRIYRFALVLLDAQFSGSPGSADKIEQAIQGRLDAGTWRNRSRVIAIDPELEAWVWSGSPHVAKILGQRQEQIRRIAAENGWWPAGSPKPSHPKDLLEAVLRMTGEKPPSAALFGELAERVSLQRCNDPAFAKLRETLRGWFGST